MRGSRQEEWIPTYADLVDWLEAAEPLTESQALRLRTGGAEAPQAAQQLFKRAIAFREALARVLLARTEGRAPANEDLRRRNQELQPPLVGDGDLRQPHEGRPPPAPQPRQRLTTPPPQPGGVGFGQMKGCLRPARISPGSPS